MLTTGCLLLWTLAGIWGVARAIDGYPAWLQRAGLVTLDSVSEHGAKPDQPSDTGTWRDFFGHPPALNRRTLFGATLVLGIAFWAIHSEGAGLKAACLMLFGWGLLVLAFVDARTLLLPDALTLPLLWLGLLLQLLPETRSIGLEAAMWGAIAGYAPLWLLAQTYRLLRGREGLGRGDLKLLAAMGAWSGAAILPDIVFLAAVLALLGIALNRVRLSYLDASQVSGRLAECPVEFPFGPWLIAAWFICCITGFTLMPS